MFRNDTRLPFFSLLSILLVLSAAGGAVAAEARATGAVYAMTNDVQDNRVVAFDRAADGTLSFQGSYSTGGHGVGDTTEPVDALGSENPLLLSYDSRWLFAVNAGSDEISVFAVRPDRLVLVDKVPSGGHFPASLTMYWNRLYVLNAGGEGNITGFTVGAGGHLAPLASSTRALAAGGTNPPSFLDSPAQVSFTPMGDELVVTIKKGNRILVFPVGADGRPSAAPVTATANGDLPFGFAFDGGGHLLVAEPGSQAVSSYQLRADGTLAAISRSVGNGQPATCWLVTDGRFVYTTNNGADTISGYQAAADGTLSLLDPSGVTAVTGEHPVDLALSPDGHFLYNLNAGSGSVTYYEVDTDGRLLALGEIGGLPADAGAVGMVVR